MSWNSGRDILVIDDLSASGLQWRAWPGAHAWIGFEIAGVTARSAALTTGNGPSTAPFVLPDSIAPPLALRLAHARVESLTVNGGAPLTALDLQGLTLDPRPGAEHGVQRFSFTGSGVAAEGAARIGNRAPLALAAQLSLRPALDGDHPRWGAALRADGPLAKLAVTGTLRGRPLPGHAAPTLDLHAVLQPLQPWPLASLSLQTAGLDLAALSPRLPATRLAGQAELSGGEAGQPLVATAELHNEAPGRWNERGLPLQRLSLRAERTADQPDRLLVSRFDLAFADASQAAGHWSGSAVWQGQTLSLQTRLEGVTPQRLDGRAAAMTLTGPLSLSLRGLPAPDGSAAAARPGVDWKLDLSGRLDATPQPVHLQLEGSADAEQVVLRNVQAQSGGASAELQATLARTGHGDWQLQSAGTLRDFDPLPWWPGEAGSGWRKGRHRLSGDWKFEVRLPGDADSLPPLALAQRLVGNGRLRIRDSVLAGVPLSADITLGYAPSAAPAPGSLNAEFELGGNRLSIRGQGDPAGSGVNDHWRAEVKAETLAALAPLARLGPALAEWVPRGGSITGALAADGRWPALHTEGNLQLSQLLVGELKLARGSAAWAMGLQGERPLALQIDLAGVQFGKSRADNLRAQLHGTLADHHIDISGALPLLPPEMAVRILGIEAQSGTQAQLHAQGSWLPDPAGGGRWRAHIEQLVIGSWDGSADTTPPASGWVETKDLRAELQFGAGGKLLALQADPGRLQLSDTASLRWDAVSLDLRGAQPQGELHASIEPFALAPLLARAQPGVGWQGDLRLTAKVDIRAAEKVDADLVFERHDGDLHIASADGLQLLGLTDLHLKLSAHDGLWNFSQTFRGRSLGEITGQIQVQTSPDRRWPPPDAPLQGSLQAHVADLGIWAAWVPPGWRLSGDLRTTAAISGRFGRPQYSGQIAGTGLGVRNLLQGVNVHDGRLSVLLAGDTAKIEQFTLRGGDGTVEVTGGATLGLQPHASLQLKADHFRVLGRVDRQIVASGNAELELDADQTRLTGKFGIDEGLYDASHADAPSLDDDVTVRAARQRRRGGRRGGRAEAAAQPGTRRDRRPGPEDARARPRPGHRTAGPGAADHTRRPPGRQWHHPHRRRHLRRLWPEPRDRARHRRLQRHRRQPAARHPRAAPQPRHPGRRPDHRQPADAAGAPVFRARHGRQRQAVVAAARPRPRQPRPQRRRHGAAGRDGRARGRRQGTDRRAAAQPGHRPALAAPERHRRARDRDQPGQAALAPLVPGLRARRQRDHRHLAARLSHRAAFHAAPAKRAGQLGRRDLDLAPAGATGRGGHAKIHRRPAVVQRIERAPPKRQIQVRFLSEGPRQCARAFACGQPLQTYPCAGRSIAPIPPLAGRDHRVPLACAGAHTASAIPGSVALHCGQGFGMHRYRVHDTSTDGAGVALHDGRGRYHLARAMAEAPGLGTDLDGSRPALGYRVLRCQASGHLFRVVFELIDGDRQSVLARLHSG